MGRHETFSSRADREESFGSLGVRRSSGETTRGKGRYVIKADYNCNKISIAIVIDVERVSRSGINEP